MEEKYTYGLYGAALGAFIMLFGLPYGAGWYTAGGAARRAEAEVQAALLPYCAKEVMADATAATELKVKRATDYDDVVRDYRKREKLVDKGYQYNRACGKVIEGLMPTAAATKS